MGEPIAYETSENGNGNQHRNDRRGVTRRTVLAGAGAAALLGQAALERAGTAAAAVRPGGHGTGVRLRQGTDHAVAVSPDGKTLATDLLGVLWVLPASGGPARRLTSDLYDVAQPEWSPDGRTLAFQSYRRGVFDLWTIRADGSRLRRLTSGPYDHREPRWSPDGEHLTFSSDLGGGSYGVYTYALGSGRIAEVADTAAEEYEPAWSPDGKRIAFVVGSTTGGIVTSTRIDVADVDGGHRTTAYKGAAGQVLHSPAWSPDGKDLVYAVATGYGVPPAVGASELYRNGAPLVTGEDVYPFRVAWADERTYYYTADGRIRRRRLGASGAAHAIGFSAAVTTVTPRYRKRRRDFESAAPQPVVGIGSPVLSPDGEQVAFRALNDVYVMRFGKKPRPLTRDHWWKSDPAWSPDGRYLSYSTDRGGKLDVWVRDLRTGRDRQLTNLDGAAAVSGTWSPDGREIAFLDQTGALWTVEVASGDVQKVYDATFEPGRPTWSRDGRTIALAAIKPYSARFREGLSEILLVNRKTGEATYVPPLPDRSLQTRGDDGPVWSPDGKRMAFVVASVLWVVDVHADGTPKGEPRQLTHEVTDAPSWSGDSKHLLFLGNGELRLVAAAGGTPRTVAVPMTWTNVQPRGRKVIHAGRLWDGTSRHLRADVDVVVEGGRIAAVEPHDGHRAGDGGERIDASHAVVIPGLVDMHNHREMQGYAYGDRTGRLWLSLGITTTRSPGSPAYHMVEEREALQSGARIGPRYFATGEAVDGPRIYYNFMRPTYDDAQLALELARAEALDYDLLKSYVRLPPVWQRRVIAWGHRRGIHSTSHYHWPAAGFGGDGMEHTGATNRFGYSRTVTALGAGYDDVIDVFNASKLARTPTLFGATTLYREDTSLVDDERIKALYPAWEYAVLTAQAKAAAEADAATLKAQRGNLRRQVEQARAMIRGGGRVLTGTDSPIANNAVSTHMNLRAMVKYGITPYEALVTATSAPGAFLNEPLGQVKAGMYADLSVLGGDPLHDIDAAADVRWVMVGGVRHTVGELVKPFAAAPNTKAAPASRERARVPRHPSNDRYWWHDPHYLEAARTSCCTD